MAVYPLPFATAARGGQVELCVLIAGYAHPIVSPGVGLTTVSWSTGTDAAWHVGTSSLTPKTWLDLPTGRPDDPPEVLVDERVRPVGRALEIAPLTLCFSDPGAPGTAELTRLLGSRRSAPVTLLGAELTAAETGTITVEDASTFGSSGDLYLGREVIGYTGKTATTFTTLTRGKYGTRARRYPFGDGIGRLSVYTNPAGYTALPTLLGRRVTVWLLRMTSSTTATDPRLVFDGRAAPGVTLRGAGWQVPLVHAIRALSEKMRPVEPKIYGYQHTGPGVRAVSATQLSGEFTPVYLRWNGTNVLLTGASATPDENGWHPSRERFLAGLRTAIDALFVFPTQLATDLDGTGRLRVHAELAGGDTLYVRTGWEAGEYWAPDRDSTDTLVDVTTLAMPPACLWLRGQMNLDATAFALIPAVPATSGHSSVTAAWTLRARCKRGVRVSKINARAALASGGYIALLPVVNSSDPQETLIIEPQAAKLGIQAQGATWYSTLRYGVLELLDQLQGLDVAADSVDWDRIAAVAPAGRDSTLPAPRDYRFTVEDPFIELLDAEAALGGFSLATFRGRIAVARIAEMASTEPGAATVAEADILGEASFVEAHDGTATRFRVEFPRPEGAPDVVRAVDIAAEAELGPGQEVVVKVPPGAIPEELVTSVGFAERIALQALTVLGPFRRPYKLVTLPLPVSYAGVEIGQVVMVSEWLLPTGSGTRGLASVPCVVVGKRLRLSRFDGEAPAVELDVIPSDTDFAGYAPEVLISAISGASLTVDTSYLGGDWGLRGFADALSPDGGARSDGGASFFAAGDKVLLFELDSTSPATPEAFTIVSVSGTTIVLAGSPTAAFTGIVGGNGRVMLTYDAYATAVAAQKRYAYLAATTLLINGVDPARRYAA